MKRYYLIFNLLIVFLFYNCDLLDFVHEINNITDKSKSNQDLNTTQQNSNINPINNFVINGNTAYIPYSLGENKTMLNIVDITDLNNITVTGSLTFSIPGITTNYGIGPVDIKLKDNNAYISMYYGGLAIINISDTKNPKFVSKWSLTNPGWGNSLQGILIDGNYLYAGFDYNNGLGVFDITDPKNPNYISNYGGIAYARFAVKKDNYVFLSTYYGSYIRIFDVSNPNNPNLVNSIYTPGYAYYIGEISGDYLYIPDSRDTYGLKIYNISNPANPVLIAKYNTESFGYGWVSNLKIIGSYAIMSFANQNNPDAKIHHLLIFDISNPNNPQKIKILEFESQKINSPYFYCINDRIYISGFDDTLYILTDIFNNEKLYSYKYNVQR